MGFPVAQFIPIFVMRLERRFRRFVEGGRFSRAAATLNEGQEEP
jgi:hypothetical protein